MSFGTKLSDCQKREILGAWPKTFRPFKDGEKNCTEPLGWSAHKEEWDSLCPWGSLYNITCPPGNEKLVDNITKMEDRRECEGSKNEYTLSNIKCHACPMGGNCTQGGYKVSVKPGWWQGPPFLRSCVDVNTMEVLNESGAVFHVESGNESHIKPSRRNAPPSPAKSLAKGSRTSPPSEASAPFKSALAPDVRCVVITSPLSDRHKYEGRANMYSKWIKFFHE